MDGYRKGKKVTCSGCGYTWAYTGALKLATCPSCNLKNKVKEKNRVVRK